MSNQSYPLSVFDRLLKKTAINYNSFSFAAQDNEKLLNDLQANILKHHKRNLACHIFIKFNKPEKQDIQRRRYDISSWINQLEITSAWKQLDLRKAEREIDDTIKKKIEIAKAAKDINDEHGIEKEISKIIQNEENKKAQVTTFYMTMSGYRFLNVAHLAPKKCLAFKNGINHNEITETFNKNLEMIISNKSIGNEGSCDALLIIADNDLDRLLDTLEKKVREIEKIGIYEIKYGWLKKNKNDDYVEWFGFKDTGGPEFFPSGKRPVQEENIPKLNTVLIKDPGGKYRQSAGSYLAFMKIQQHYKAFEDLRDEIKNKLENTDGKEAEYGNRLAEANIIGKFIDGTPLTLSDTHESNGLKYNKFNYKEQLKITDKEELQDDSHGMRCPFHAHIRKANPRSTDKPYDDKTLYRRGMLYFEQEGLTFSDNNRQELRNNLEKIHNKDRESLLKLENKKLGILFFSFQSHIENQFEFVIKNRMHRNVQLPDGTSTGTDILTSNGEEEYYFPKKWNSSDENERFLVEKKDPLTTLLCGEYFFAPSISFLKSLIEENPKAPAENNEWENTGSSVENKIAPRLKRVKRMEETGAMAISDHFIGEKVVFKPLPRKVRPRLKKIGYKKMNPGERIENRRSTKLEKNTSNKKMKSNV